MTIGKVIGYSIFGVAAAAVGTSVIAIGAAVGFVALNQKAAEFTFGTGRKKPEPTNEGQAS